MPSVSEPAQRGRTAQRSTEKFEPFNLMKAYAIGGLLFSYVGFQEWQTVGTSKTSIYGGVDASVCDRRHRKLANLARRTATVLSDDRKSLAFSKMGLRAVSRISQQFFCNVRCGCTCGDFLRRVLSGQFAFDDLNTRFSGTVHPGLCFSVRFFIPKPLRLGRRQTAVANVTQEPDGSNLFNLGLAYQF